MFSIINILFVDTIVYVQYNSIIIIPSDRDRLVELVFLFR